jgi:hypothetical protein
LLHCVVLYTHTSVSRKPAALLTKLHGVTSQQIIILHSLPWEHQISLDWTYRSVPLPLYFYLPIVFSSLWIHFVLVGIYLLMYIFIYVYTIYSVWTYKTYVAKCIYVWTLKIIQAIYLSLHVTSEGIFNNMN